MLFYKGFIAWGIVTLLIGTICCFLFKFLKQLERFENRNSEIKVSCFMIFFTTITYLFLPMILCKSPFFTNTKNRFIDGIKNDIVSRTRDAFYEEAEEAITYIVDSMINTEEMSGVIGENIEDAKENVVKYAVKYSKNRTLKDSLDNAFKLFKIDEINKESFDENVKSKTLTECNKIVEKYSKDIRENYVQNSLLKPWVEPIVKNVSMESFTGLPPNKKSVSAFEKAKNAFDKLFMRIAVFMSLITSAIIILIVFLIPEFQKDNVTINTRDFMFEYKETVFEEMNRTVL